MNWLIYRPITIVSRGIYAPSRYFCTSPEIPKNVFEEYQNAQNQTKPGIIYDKKPFRMTLKKGTFPKFNFLCCIK